MSKIDYKTLLKKYISYVECSEGTNFLNSMDCGKYLRISKENGRRDYPKLTNNEVLELNKLALEIDEYEVFLINKI